MHHLIPSRTVIAISLSLVAAMVSSPARAQTENPPAYTIRVTGEASVTSRPDRVELDLGVVTRALTSQQAAAENARALRNVLDSLRRALGPNADIETINYALFPNYSYPQNAPPKITGYTATNTVRVTHDDLANVGAVIDAATRSGANQIDRIRFTLKDEAAAKASALRIATVEARAKAGVLANTLGLQIARIHSVEEAAPMPRPMYSLELRSAADATTPIIPGEIETTAVVTLTVDLGAARR